MNEFSGSGTGESGKSTFLNHLRVIHDQRFSTIDLEKFKLILRDNVLSSMRLMFAGANRLGVQIPEKYQVRLSFSLKFPFCKFPYLFFPFNDSDITLGVVEKDPRS
jgi:hypothetical protein